MAKRIKRYGRAILAPGKIDYAELVGTLLDGYEKWQAEQDKLIGKKAEACGA